MIGKGKGGIEEENNGYVVFKYRGKNSPWEGREREGTHEENIEEENNGYVVFINTEGKTLPQSERKGVGTQEGKIDQENNGNVVFKWNIHGSAGN